ncbi:MAG: hypothetical protein GKS00_16965 [Alphaproteobacteria bacterium]|nr:hypothetical protein [Alphaproteobacteria bacterium]
MGKHGASGGFEPADAGRRDGNKNAQTDYRNMFGDAKARELYDGFGHSAANRTKTRRMLRWLAQCMVRDRFDASDENPRIPAGYTYLAQLVSHDSVQSLAPLPDMSGKHLLRRNARSARLLLDTVYGGGPEADPLAYAIDGRTWEDRARLRLSVVESVRRSGSPKLGTLRDVARTGCPYIEDRANFPPGNAVRQQTGSPDALIADPRNDDNVILSQLTVLFILLHNQLCAAVEKLDGKKLTYRRFNDVRRVVTLVYRRIVFDDLLRKLLHPAVYEVYRKKNRLADFGDGTDDWRMPLEFSHAVYRFGHAMVRGTYEINDELQKQGLIQMVRRNSAMRPQDVPLTHDWLVDWSFLFATGKDREQPSRKIGPAFNEEFVKGYLFPVSADEDATKQPDDNDGLVYRDLVRGADAGLRTVKSVLDNLDSALCEHSPLVRRGRVSSRKIAAWLRTRAGDSEDALADDYIKNISRDPPLLFFLLLEAGETEITTGRAADRRSKGECLGPIGSALLAEFFFRERVRSYDVIEGDKALGKFAATLFQARGVPGSMPDLVAEVAAGQDWTDPKYQFV